MKPHVERLLRRAVEYVNRALGARDPMDEIENAIGFLEAAREAEQNPDAVLEIAGETFGPEVRQG